jgi:nucleotide-binding universal stress UspA family protein
MDASSTIDGGTAVGTAGSFDGTFPASYVVVGVDDSKCGREALRRAGEVAAERGWGLKAVHCWHMTYPVTPYGMVPIDTTTLIREAAEETLATVVEQELGPNPAFPVVRLLYEGSAAGHLVEESKGAELLVVGSRGRGGFASLALGSVSSACVHHAHCPVLVIRPHDNLAKAS